jgi:hypothetical protein
MTPRALILTNCPFRQLLRSIDANDITQLAAFAVLRHADIDCIADFLTWFRAPVGDRYPKAFMIDRSDAVIKAISLLCPESGRQHIFHDLQRKVGKMSRLVKDFWPAVKSIASPSFRQKRNS